MTVTQEEISLEEKNLKRTIAASASGQFLEWYDFYIYGVLATTIAELFFKNIDPAFALFYSLAIFAVGFMTRPFGGLLFGYASDKFGRKPVFIVTLIVMSIATTLVGFLPTYAQAGSLGAILMLCLRLIQGMALGGESAASTIYIAEHSPAKKHIFFASWLYFGATGGWLLASCVGLLLNSFLNHEQFLAWGWRIPFLLGLFTGIIGLILRIRSKETPVYQKLKETGQLSKSPVKEVLKTSKLKSLQMFAFISASSLIFYTILVYFPIFMTQHGMSPKVAWLIISCAAGASLISTIFFGWFFTDKIPTKAPMYLFYFGFLFAPVYFYALSFNDVVLSSFTLGVVVFFLSMCGCSQFALIGKWFAPQIRGVGVSISFNIASAFTGGTAPLVGSALTHFTGSALAPGFYITLWSIIGLLVIWSYKE